MGLGHPPSSQTEDTAVTACSPCRGSGFVQYIDGWSLWFDIRILVGTVVVGFADAKAY